MEVKTQRISPTEWQVMRIVWTLGETTAQEIIKIMHKKTDWSQSTIKTLITRLVKKGFLLKNETTRPLIYTASVKDLEMMKIEANELFNSFCAHCAGEVLEDVIQKISLSKDDIDRIEMAANDKKKTAPNQIDCNCL